MKRLAPSDLVPIALRGRHAGELLATPCTVPGCHRRDCTIGVHVFHATKDAEPGIRAQNFDPDSGGWKYEEVHYGDGSVELATVAFDSTGESATSPADPLYGAHAEFEKVVRAYEQASDDLEIMLGAYRPDRKLPKVGEPSEDEWCRPCLQQLGKCAPRFRGDECSWHYKFKLAHGFDAPVALAKMHHEGKRITTRDIADAIQLDRAAQRAKRKRKK